MKILIMESSNNIFLLLANNPRKTKRLFEDFIIKIVGSILQKMLCIYPMQKIYDVKFKLTERVIEYM